MAPPGVTKRSRYWAIAHGGNESTRANPSLRRTRDEARYTIDVRRERCAVSHRLPDTINFLDYIVAENRAKFLFGHYAMTFLAKMRHALSQLGYASSMLKGDRLEGDELRKHLDIQRQSMEQLSNFWTRFDELALPYMRMAQKMPWVPSR